MNDDLISRQDAIDALREEVEWEYDEKDEQWYYIEADMAIGAIERLPSAQLEERTKERTETHACDSIKRQDAIDALCKRCDLVNDDTCGEKCIDIKILEKLPPAEPERKKGEWINRSLNILYPEFERYTCSVCGKHSYSYDFCPHCGSYNGGESDDKGRSNRMADSDKRQIHTWW